MSYKGLNDAFRRGALGTFLDAANQIPGLLLTFAIDRGVHSLFRRDDRDTVRSPELNLLAGMSSITAERTMRVIHLASLCLRGTTRADQDVLWITDEDEIVPNEKRLRRFVDLFTAVSSHYLVHDLRHLRIGTTRLDTGRRDVEDLVAICDLAAGALQDNLSLSKDVNFWPRHHYSTTLAYPLARKPRL
jgi:hypothetical protein